MTTTTERAQTGLPRLLPSPAAAAAPRPHDWHAHVELHGRLPYRDRAGVLIRDIEAAGLTGRGGAAFPVHVKLEAVLQASGLRSSVLHPAGKRRRTPVVIANGAESEPASEKDATLLWLAPHLVLDGLQLAAEAVGADTAILYTHASRQHDVGGRLKEAISERHAAGLDRVPVQLAVAPARFLSGQETALLNHLSGGPAIPTFIPPRITERGLHGAPTLVQNVETLAHLALIAQRGPQWFREVGTETEPGSMLATVRRADGQTKITEVPLGIPITDLTGELQPDQGVLIGGYHGTWLTGRQARQLTLDNRSLGQAHPQTQDQARVGAGIVIVLPPGRCGLAETANVVRYLALESAGQCGPCLNGLPRIAAALAEIAAGQVRPDVLAAVERWSGLVTGRGACHHPDGTARFVASALRAFEPELELHRTGRCTVSSSTGTSAGRPYGSGPPAPFLPVPAAGARTEADWS